MALKPGLLGKALLVYNIHKNQTQRVTPIDVQDFSNKRSHLGEANLLEGLRSDNEEKYHKSYYRMEKAQFDEILVKISPHIDSDNHVRPISAQERLAITLRFLATGSKQINLAFNYRVTPLSVYNIVTEVMTAICMTMEAEFLAEPTKEDWLRSAANFEEKWNFPHACGAVDVKHIRLKCPPKSESLYYYYKDFYSIVLMAVADANYCFQVVDIRSYGSVSVDDVLKNSIMGKKMKENDFNLPPAKVLNIDTQVPAVFLGNDAFPLKNYLMKPFADRKRRELTIEQKIYNYRHSRAQMVVENTFGIYAARWRIFETPLEIDLKTAKLVVKTCVILHNYLTKRGDNYGLTVDREVDGERVGGTWRRLVIGDTGISELRHHGSNNATYDAFSVRDKFKSYFMTPTGSVPL